MFFLRLNVCGLCEIVSLMRVLLKVRVMVGCVVGPAVACSSGVVRWRVGGMYMVGCAMSSAFCCAVFTG